MCTLELKIYREGCKFMLFALILFIGHHNYLGNTVNEIGPAGFHIGT